MKQSVEFEILYIFFFKYYFRNIKLFNVTFQNSKFLLTPNFRTVVCFFSSL